MNMQGAPLVTVIICVYNAGEYLRPSVQSVLGQTHANLEILIVDDGSTDGCMATIEDLRDPRIRVIRQENQGKPAAMNAALDALRGEFYAINDADDLSHPQRIERQLAAMQANPAVAAVYCCHELILDDRRVAPTFHAKGVEVCRRDVEQFLMPAHDPTGMYRMSMVQELRYEQDLLLGEGLDYMLRVGERRPMIVLGECLYSYRIHRASLTKRNPEVRDRLVWEALRRACRRRGIDFEARFPQAQQSWGRRNAARDNGIAAHFMDSACDLKRSGRQWEAVKVGLECARLHPLDSHYYKALIYSLVPSVMLSHLRPSARQRRRSEMGVAT